MKRARDTAAAATTSATPGNWRGRQCVVLKNDSITVMILTGGGHIISIEHSDAAGINPLWEPPWSAEATMDPSLRRLATEAGIAEPGEPEGELLAGIGGINFCCDVFGAHSAGEVKEGLSFHGEAGLATWEVDSWKDGKLTMTAHLQRSLLRCTREYSLDGEALLVSETVTNLASFERAMGRCQHVTIGEEFLGRGARCSFHARCDKGMTWPEDMDSDGALCSQWEPATEFAYPHIPRRARGGASGTDDWTQFPREGTPVSSDLATMRVDPTTEEGTCGVLRHGQGTTPALQFTVKWERKAFPWLMTWEENRARQGKPWNGRTLCRGLEISSYAFATSRRDNVERGKLFGTPCFEWFDARETKTTSFTFELLSLG